MRKPSQTKTSGRHILWRVAMICSLTCASAFGSDGVLIHGHIYVGDAKKTWAQALAFTGSRIDAVGTDEEILKLKQAKTKVIDLQGRTVIAGITDTHTHMWFGALALRGFNAFTPEERIRPEDGEAFVSKLRAYAATHRKDKILFGRTLFAVDPKSAANRQLLDRAVPDRPVVIHNTSEHSLWVNSKTLEMAGVTDSPAADPLEEKYVVRDENGHATGILVDPAMQLVVRALPLPPLEERAAILREAAQYMNSFGITSVINATGNLKEIEAYAALRDRGQLTIRTRTAFAEVSVNQRFTPQFLADLDKARKLYSDEWVSANLVKFFADGAGATTSRFLPDETSTPGWYDPAELITLVQELDKRGYQIMTHSIGNAATRMVLDAYEQVERTNGPRDRRFRMTHLFSITAQDLPRFAKLSVLADFQPAFCCGPDDPKQKSNQWRSLVTSGVNLSFSSDWPCSWPPNPFNSVQQAVERRQRNYNAGTESNPLQFSWPDEALTVEQAVDAYTIGSARAGFAEERTGSLEPGKNADLIVLSQDIFSVPVDQIGKTMVVLTMVGGKVVYDRASDKGLSSKALSKKTR
jgi:predicted amidohydrolase YtcJ